MSFSALAQSRFLKTIATLSSFVFVSALLINPELYSKEDQYLVSAQFIANNYVPDSFLIDPSLSDLSNDPLVQTDTPKKLKTHTVKSADTLSVIAQQYGVSIKQLQAINNISDPSTLKPGSKLYITSQQGILYTVKETTSLMVFANLYDLDEAQLMDANDQDDNMAPYSPGQGIFIPSKSISRLYENGLLKKPEEPKKILLANKKAQKPFVSSPRRVVFAGTVVSGKSSIVRSWRENMTEDYGFAAGNCTDYAAAKADFAFGKGYKGWAGNAVNWLVNAKRAGFKTSNTPTVGSIGVMSNGGNGNPAGHVVIVESVDWENKRILVSDMNYQGKHTVTVRYIDMNASMTQSTIGNQRFIGFIPVQKRP